MEEKLFRNRVAWMMFLLSILVIWVHSYNVELFAGRAPGVSFDQAAGLETFLSVTVGQIAVPVFSCCPPISFSGALPGISWRGNGNGGFSALPFPTRCGIFYIIWAM